VKRLDARLVPIDLRFDAVDVGLQFANVGLQFVDVRLQLDAAVIGHWFASSTIAGRFPVRERASNRR
jgi:hypothetical protein